MDRLIRVASENERRGEIREHRDSFDAFRHMVVFASFHVALTLACVALAFIGHLKLIAFLLWLGGTLAAVAVLTVYTTGDPAKHTRPTHYKQTV